MIATIIVASLVAAVVSLFVSAWRMGRARRSVKCEPEHIGRRPERSCPVDGCQIRVPHSHTEDFVRRLRGR